MRTLFVFLHFYKLIMSKILIIDDEVQIRSLLARMLGLEGYEVCQAGDCKAAIRQLEIQQPDVALCDVFLPDGNGVDLVLNIKRQLRMWKSFFLPLTVIYPTECRQSRTVHLII